MNRQLLRPAWIVVLLLLGAWDPVTKKQTDVDQGNQKLAAGKADEAAQHYQKALGELGPSPGVLYDLGAAHYAAAQAMPAGDGKKKLLESAEKELRLAGDAPETGLRSSAHYNLGNTLFAEEKYKDAIEEYKKSLRLQPEREDARHNLELTLARLPPPSPQQKPQPDPKNDDKKKDQQKQSQADKSQQPKPSDDQKQDQKNDQQQQEQDQQQQEQQQQQESKAKPGEDKDKPPEKRDQAPKPDEPKPGDEQQKPQPTAGKSTDDRDTDRKLDLLEDKSKDLQVQKAQERAREKRRRGQPVKDW